MVQSGDIAIFLREVKEPIVPLVFLLSLYVTFFFFYLSASLYVTSLEVYVCVGSQKSGALIVRYSLKEECICFVFYCFDNLSIAITLDPLVQFR